MEREPSLLSAQRTQPPQMFERFPRESDEKTTLPPFPIFIIDKYLLKLQKPYLMVFVTLIC